MVARLVRDQEAMGSSPVTSTKDPVEPTRLAGFFLYLLNCGASKHRKYRTGLIQSCQTFSFCENLSYLLFFISQKAPETSRNEVFYGVYDFYGGLLQQAYCCAAKATIWALSSFATNIAAPPIMESNVFAYSTVVQKVNNCAKA